MKPTFFIIDGHALMHRCYHSPGAALRSPSGEPTKVTYTFTKILFKLIRMKPDFIACAVDTSRAGLRRRRAYPKYKANRDTKGPPDPTLSQQIKRCREVTELLGIPVLKKTGYEADDIIAGVIKHLDGECVVKIIGKDKDLHQLLDEDVTMYDVHSAESFTADDCRNKHGIWPWQMRDYLALCGDSSDNIPGLPGVGPVTASKLLRQWESLDAILDNLDRIDTTFTNKVYKHRELLEISKVLVTLEDDVPVDMDYALSYEGLTIKKAKPLFAELGFKQWA